MIIILPENPKFELIDGHRMTDPKRWWQWLITHRIEQVHFVFYVNWFEIKEQCFYFKFRLFERFCRFRIYLISHVCIKFEESLKFMTEISILKIVLNSFHSLYCIFDRRIWRDSYECIHKKIYNICIFHNVFLFWLKLTTGSIWKN